MGILDENRVLDMTDKEIKQNVLEAADQKAQVKIVAELNATTEYVIKNILRKQGVDLRRLRGAAKKQLAEQKPRKYKKPEIIPAPPKKITLPEAMAAIRAELDEINRQQYELDMRKGDLYKQLWDMMGEM